MTDLLALTAELVDIPSVSRGEAALAKWLVDRLDPVPWLEVERVGDNVIARTELGRSSRLLLVGHTDTVPPNGNDRARIDGDRLYGVGATDMKGGLAVMVDAAETVDDPAVDVTYVFYAREEIAAAESGLLELFDRRPDLVSGDAALIGEPTSGAIEAGCQGTMRVKITFAGQRAHTARPWMGVNAIHRMGLVLAELDRYSEREPVIEGCHYHEVLQAVGIHGGVAGNVVPDTAELLVNHRFAPDRDALAAEAHVRETVGHLLGDEDGFEVVDCASGAPPRLDHPLISTIRNRNQLEVSAKLGWTDVARFAEHGIPAVNFGPGVSALAHSADEYVEGKRLDAVRSATLDMLHRGTD